MLGKGLLAVGMFFVLLALIVVGLYFSTSNKEIGLRNQFLAQEKVNTVVYDTVWKIISQKAQITEQYKGDFQQVWKEILTSQNSGQHALQVFINRINPQFDSGLYKDLMVTVESQRKEFLNNQKKLTDIKRSHDNLLQQAPSSFFVGGRPPLELHLITSGKTEEIFEKGREDNIKVFEKS